jgi:hypothetical protein
MPQSIPKGITREHVLKALAELGAGARPPFGKPMGYELIHDGKRYAPKAVVGLAYRHFAGRLLHHKEFSGGEAPGQANFVLRRLGFEIVTKEQQAVEPAPQAWSDAEVEVIVGDYFDMLQKELRGEAYNKAEHNRTIRSRLVERSKSSVEFKHQNISAVLLELGLPYIDGYKPASNYQASLAVAVREYLQTHQAVVDSLAETKGQVPAALPKVGRLDSIFEAPPSSVVVPQRPIPPWQLRSGQRIDFVEREAANRQLGSLGEQFAVELEKRRLLNHRRDDLAQKVLWVSQSWGDGVGFDVLSFDEQDDSELWIEVKTTSLGKHWPFYVSANELRCSEAVPDRYALYRLFSFSKAPRLFVLHGSLPDHCLLEPIQFRATVNG